MRTLVSRNPSSVGLAVAAIVLIAAAGFCLFDADGNDHDGAGLDLCVAILPITLSAALFIALGVVGGTAEQISWAATPAAIAIPDPPPWR
jgi:hypothetical protein